MHDPRGFCLVKEKTNYYTIFLPFPETMEEEVLLMLKEKKTEFQSFTWFFVLALSKWTS